MFLNGIPSGFEYSFHDVASSIAQVKVNYTFVIFGVNLWGGGGGGGRFQCIFV